MTESSCGCCIMLFISSHHTDIGITRIALTGLPFGNVVCVNGCGIMGLSSAESILQHNRSRACRTRVCCDVL